MVVNPNMVYLVSASPRRRELLRQIGVPFETLLLRSDPARGVDVDETPHQGENSLDYVRRVAAAKANEGWRRLADRRLPPHPVLGADTAVVIGDRIIGKPQSAMHAMEILRELSGTTHRVLTAVALCAGHYMDIRISETQVTFGDISGEEIRDYVSSGEPLDKAGAYGIQGRAASFIERIDGSYSGVMGLPLFETTQMLKKVRSL